MDLCYDVTNQKVTRNAKKFIVNRSQNYLQLIFDFKTTDWEDTTKYCIFHHNGKHYKLELVNGNKVIVPSVVLTGRSFRFTVFATSSSNEEEVIITGEEVTVHLRESGYLDEYDIIDDMAKRVLDEIYESIDGKSDKGHIHDDRYYTETETNTLLEGKANTSHTHTKSQITDFPTLATVATSGSYNDLSNKPSIPSSSSDLSDGSDLVKKSSTSGLLKNDGTVDTTSYSTFSGSYNDLSNKPSIPSKISDLTNDSDFIEKSSTSGLVKNDGTIDTNTYLTQHQSLTGYLQTTDIADNLTTNDASKVLSAKQGKLLKDLIGDAITYING